jgi:hypothetical protein
MTRLQKTAALIALAICFAGAVAGELWEASHSPHTPSQGRPAEQQYAAENKTEQKSNPNRNETQSLWVPTDSIGLYTLVLSGFTAVLAIATISLCLLSFSQIRLARAEFISTHRPRVRVRRVYLSAFAARFGADNISHGDDVEVEIVIANAGETNAYITNSRYRLYFFQTALPEDDSLFGEFPRRIIDQPMTLACGESKRLFVTSKAVMAAPPPGHRIMRQLAAEGWHMHIVGLFSYQDDSGTFRETGFLREWQRGGGFRKVEDSGYEYED